MAIYVNLINKHSHKVETFPIVDDKLCEWLGVKATDQFYKDWYNHVGFALACGRTFSELRERFSECTDLLIIIDYLDNNYTVDTYWGK